MKPKLNMQMAYDRSMRSFDEEGRLRVELTPISKANICPYWGREIPNYERLGLRPDKIYQLFRAPEELQKAARTSNSIQLLDEHDAVSAARPLKEKIAGTTGTDAIYEHPYLKNSLSVWTKSAIDLITSNKKKRLSCGYQYDPDMTPGTYMGIPYDGVMRNIRFNHIALVIDGRAGADVMVADEMPVEFNSNGDIMPKFTPVPTSRAAIASGAIAAFMLPRLAEDAKIDLFKNIVPAGITKKTWMDAKEVILGRIHNASRSLLAKDQSLDDLPTLLDALDHQMASDAWPEKDEDDDEKKARDAKARKARDAKLKAAKDAKAKKAKDVDADEDDAREDEDDEEEKDEAAEGKALKDNKDDTEDEDMEEMEEDKKKARDAKRAKDKGAKDAPLPVSRAAMDKAISRAVTDTEERIRQANRDLREALELVQPVIGKIAADSAEEVYEALFEAQGIEYDDVPSEGYKGLAKQAVKLATLAKDKAPANQRAAQAHDRAMGGFFKAFPDAARIWLAV